LKNPTERVYTSSCGGPRPGVQADVGTPVAGKSQGGDPCWYDLYRRIRKAGKSVMPCWVEPQELRPLQDQVEPEGLNVLMHFRTEREIDAAVRIAEECR
jgi:hypothetical protein